MAAEHRALAFSAIVGFRAGAASSGAPCLVSSRAPFGAPFRAASVAPFVAPSRSPSRAASRAASRPPQRASTCLRSPSATAGAADGTGTASEADAADVAAAADGADVAAAADAAYPVDSAAADAAAADAAAADAAAADAATAAARGLAADVVIVRFINVPDSADVLVPASPGDNLLSVGDGAGVHIPRGCRSGLCGACTSDVVCAEEHGGVQTVRACQASVALWPGQEEMVVDVRRIADARGSNDGDPMARFDDMDTGYVARAAPRRKNAMRMQECARCGATGDVECYGCDGQQAVLAADAASGEAPPDCLLCMGTGVLRCAKCQGAGQCMQ